VTWVTTCLLQFSASSSWQLAVALVCPHLQLVHSKLLKIPRHCLPEDSSHLPITLKDLQYVILCKNREMLDRVLPLGKMLSSFITLILMKIFSPYNNRDSSVLKKLKKRLISNS